MCKANLIYLAKHVFIASEFKHFLSPTVSLNLLISDYGDRYNLENFNLDNLGVLAVHGFELVVLILESADCVVAIPEIRFQLLKPSLEASQF